MVNTKFFSVKKHVALFSRDAARFPPRARRTCPRQERVIA
jgi:hypothetical protein